LLLGVGENRVVIREEQREHTHIVGTTGEGKSKLLEYLIRHDIDQGKGVCFLDPSDMGDTMYNILRYCYQKGIEKVCLIDPYHRFKFNRVPVINPFHYNFSYKDASVANIMETIKTVFGQKDSADTPRIQKYLPAVLRILWASKSTLTDSIYFTQKKYASQREMMYEELDLDDRDISMLEEVYRTVYTQEHLQSTINRLQPFYDDTMKLMFGYPKGINFPKMIAEGWVILVNLYSGFGFEPIHTRLLGTTIINEIIFALDRLRNRGWRGTHYLYVDEAGRYANRNLADLLAYKRKSGLRVTIAHQYYNQFEDKYVLDAIQNLCKLKIAFYMPNREDRDKFVRMAYGGELADREVSYVLSGQSKQYAVIKKPKTPAMIARIPDVPPVEVPKEILDKYIWNIYSQDWYKTPKEINESFANRYPVQSKAKGDPKPPRKAPVSNRKTTSQSPSKPTAFTRARTEGIQPNNKDAGKDGKGQAD
jgi:hypothetical protein